MASDEPRPFAVRLAVSGEQLASLQLVASSGTVADLRNALVKEVEGLEPFDLLAGGRLLEATSTLEAVGLGGGGTVDVVRNPWPREFLELASVPLFGQGYHCHDTWFSRLATPSPHTFWGAHLRSYRGESYEDYIASIRKYRFQENTEEPVTEVAWYEMAAWAGEAHLSEEQHDKAFAQLLRTARLTKEVAKGLQLGSAEQALAVDKEGRLLVPSRLPGDSSDGVEGEGQLLLHLVDASVAGGPAWQTVYTSAAGQSWRAYSAAWVGDRLFVFGVAAKARFLVELSLEPDGLLVERRRVPQEGGGQSYRKLLGADAAGQALFLSSSEGVDVAPLDSLVSRQVISFERARSELKKGVKLSRCALDPVSRDIFVFLDHSEAISRGDSNPHCSIHRIRPTDRSASASELEYTEPAPGDHICDADFAIDGFSDSFCITAVGYCASGDRLLVLDAGATLWALKLRDLRRDT